MSVVDPRLLIALFYDLQKQVDREAADHREAARDAAYLERLAAEQRHRLEHQLPVAESILAADRIASDEIGEQSQRVRRRADEAISELREVRRRADEWFVAAEDLRRVWLAERRAAESDLSAARAELSRAESELFAAQQALFAAKQALHAAEGELQACRSRAAFEASRPRPNNAPAPRVDCSRCEAAVAHARSHVARCELQVRQAEHRVAEMRNWVRRAEARLARAERGVGIAEKAVGIAGAAVSDAETGLIGAEGAGEAAARAETAADRMRQSVENEATAVVLLGDLTRDARRLVEQIGALTQAAIRHEALVRQASLGARNELREKAEVLEKYDQPYFR
jgi:chromosome segregation protein